MKICACVCRKYSQFWHYLSFSFFFFLPSFFVALKTVIFYVINLLLKCIFINWYPISFIAIWWIKCLQLVCLCCLQSPDLVSSILLLILKDWFTSTVNWRWRGTLFWSLSLTHTHTRPINIHTKLYNFRHTKMNGILINKVFSSDWEQ